MEHVSLRISSLAASATLAMSQKSNELRAAGIDVINLSVGEPDFNTPERIKQAAHTAIDDNYSHYTPVAGYATLRQAVVEKLRRENGLDGFTPEQIVVGNGAKQELCNVILAAVNPGDEVIIPTPAWVSYVEMVKLAEGKVVKVACPAEQGFKLTAAQLRAAITPRTRLLMLNSPSNPTGAVYSREELQALAEVLADYPDVLVLSDEIYEHINYTGAPVASIAAFPAMKGRVAIVNGVSKAYAMTGWRIGWVAAPLWLAKAVSKLQGQYTSGASSIAQKAAEAAYDGSDAIAAEVERMRAAFASRRALICRLLAAIPGLELCEPDGAFYVFPGVSAFFGRRHGDTVVNNSADLAMYLLNEAHVATVAGSAFDAEGFIRLSYATSEQNIITAVERIKVALANLR